MNKRIWRLGLVAVAVAAVVVIGIVLLAGQRYRRATVSQLIAGTGSGARPACGAGQGGRVGHQFRRGRQGRHESDPGRDDGASALAIQADGKIVVAGGARYRVARYNSDGTLDATFGGDGKVRIDFTSGSGYATGVAIQADGKIVVVGIRVIPGNATRTRSSPSPATTATAPSTRPSAATAR